MEEAVRVALVTGGAKRVGRAIVERLADAGFDVAFTYRQSEREADDLLAFLAARQRRGIAVQVDLTDPEKAVAEIGAKFAAVFNRLDVLVNNASVYELSSLQSTDISQMRRLWAIHVESPLLLCRRFEPMLRAAQGHVVNMVDLLAEKPWPPYLAYCASKAGLLNLTRGLAKELAPQVTVNGIAPGVVEWPDGMPEAERLRYLQRVPLQRAGAPKDVADLVYFLCTDASYLTGQIIHLDGGRSIM